LRQTNATAVADQFSRQSRPGECDGGHIAGGVGPRRPHGGCAHRSNSIESVAMADFLHDNGLAAQVELNSIIARPDSIPARQAMPKELDSADRRPTLEAGEQAGDTVVNLAAKLVHFALGLRGQDDVFANSHGQALVPPPRPAKWMQIFSVT